MMLAVNHGMLKKCSDMIRKAGAGLRTPLEWLRRYYSHVLETEVSMARAKAMTEAQVAFFAVAMPVDYPVIIRIAVCAWFVVALKRTKDRG